MDTAEIFELTGRLRRAQPRNADVLAACGELERLARLLVARRLAPPPAPEMTLQGLKRAVSRDQQEKEAMKRGLGTTAIGKRRAKRLRK